MKCFLKDNSPEIQQQLKDAGIECCLCCEFEDTFWLYYSSITPNIVHGVYPDTDGSSYGWAGKTREEEEKLFLKRNPDVIDCGTDVDLFIKTIKDGK